MQGRRDQGLKPVVVVSAMAKVTDQLLAAAAAAGRDDRAGAMALACGCASGIWIRRRSWLVKASRR